MWSWQAAGYHSFDHNPDNHVGQQMEFQAHGIDLLYLSDHWTFGKWTGSWQISVCLYLSSQVKKSMFLLLNITATTFTELSCVYGSLTLCIRSACLFILILYHLLPHDSCSCLANCHFFFCFHTCFPLYLKFVLCFYLFQC